MNVDNLKCMSALEGVSFCLHMLVQILWTVCVINAKLVNIVLVIKQIFFYKTIIKISCDELAIMSLLSCCTSKYLSIAFEIKTLMILNHCCKNSFHINLQAIGRMFEANTDPYLYTTCSNMHT